MSARHRLQAVPTSALRRVRVPLGSNWATEFLSLRQAGRSVKLDHRARIFALDQAVKVVPSRIRRLSLVAGVLMLVSSAALSMAAASQGKPSNHVSRTIASIATEKTMPAACSGAPKDFNQNELTSAKWQNMGGISFAEISVRCPKLKTFRVIRSSTDHSIVSAVLVK